MFQALGAKQVFLTTRCNFPSLWNLPRGGVWPAELEKGKQILLSMPRNNLGQEEQTRDRILQTCYPNFSPVLHPLGTKGGRIHALSSTICLSPSKILTVPAFPCFLESSRSQSLLGRSPSKGWTFTPGSAGSAAHGTERCGLPPLSQDQLGLCEYYCPMLLCSVPLMLSQVFNHPWAKQTSPWLLLSQLRGVAPGD